MMQYRWSRRWRVAIRALCLGSLVSFAFLHLGGPAPVAPAPRLHFPAIPVWQPVADHPPPHRRGDALNARVTAGRPAAPQDRLPPEFRIWSWAFKALIAGSLGVATLLLLFCTVSTYSTHAALARQAARYNRAPGCLTPGSAGASAGCHAESARIDGKYSAGQDWRTRHYYLLLQRATGQRSTVEALGAEGQGLWHAAGVGDRVVVQMWKGRLTMVWAGPYAMRTDQNPDYQYTQNTEGLVLPPVMTVMFALGTVRVAVARPRRPRSSPAVAVTTW